MNSNKVMPHWGFVSFIYIWNISLQQLTGIFLQVSLERLLPLRNEYSSGYVRPSVCLFQNFDQTISQQPLAGIYWNFKGGLTINRSCAGSMIFFLPSPSTKFFTLVTLGSIYPFQRYLCLFIYKQGSWWFKCVASIKGTTQSVKL